MAIIKGFFIFATDLIFNHRLKIDLMKKIKYSHLVLIPLLWLTSCKTAMSVSEVKPYENISIASSIPFDGEMDRLIQPYKKEMERQMNTKISYTPVELTKTGDNSNLGGLLADYTYEGADVWAKQNLKQNVDAAVINIGGIRSTIGKGDILLKHIFEVMPFENEVVIVKMQGKDLLGMFDYYAETQKNNPVSHLFLETNNKKITKGLVNGKELDLGKDYYIATSDYLALGGDNMWFFSKGEMISTGIKLRDLFIEKFKQNPEVNAPNDVRLIFNN
ncbi:5'-nucleotidase C-terminal domain-containing protein [Riemerella anatipestifer]|uniref:5'-nucleotidase C-terminal domain-containing protein n=1 Tax=Riemerella anatipestifer TaxID=34085 RepID=UPI002859FDD0|nr:5'-nucleotidase C-terminal domain-containing protein [Riemerella anatipestifer]MDR7671696.1 5'-nucleotidase C-terminal domain-containing protein [Riemerella anatipestifer]MDR7691686.1 5'-nucleotidase C-terminal domain-containing protein [Riemerella anatipestifer]MDR7698445.1 5'-nucleotidase C-terminal domain-containing protein [Riemerella anatipestifer]MDR7706413.1 5'-nucleotidase C-terminal domain-containing protein [Riemerella anatipestifer]MDR7708612.1 5'-nucleotidase C-terminal domain-c